MSNALKILRSKFGYTDFRGHQAEIIDNIVHGRNAFVLMPTGSGKSLCYQIPALLRPGVAVIISPLIALMQNQTRALHELGIKAAFLNSSLNMQEALEVEEALLNNSIDLIYVAPERLMMPSFQDLIARSKIALFAIDEAHCVSQWGHDFRKEYAELSILPEKFPDIPRIALTATADELTRKDIIETLALNDAPKFISGFDRPNIRYTVAEKNNAKKQLLQFINDHHQGHSGIIYCLSRKGVDQTVEWLTGQGINALAYHAGLPTDLRAKNQEAFLAEDGVLMVATIAFGMGIDKPDIRFVAHLNLPKTLEEYYQETGRAGRDGYPANAWMSYGLQDVIIHRNRLSSNDSLNDQKIIEQRKLDAILGYAETNSCRRSALLNYFGDEYQGPCNNCDNCLNPPATWDASRPVQMALSAILRTRERFGVAHIIDVLVGKKTEKVLRFRHEELSVFGVGAEFTAPIWRSIFRQLVAMNLVSVDHNGYGAFKSNGNSLPVLKGQEKVFLRKLAVKEKKAREKSSKIPEFSDSNTPLFEALKLLRLQIASKLSVPPYVVFHDKSLRHMAEVKPRSLSEMSSIHGVGESKLKKFGDQFIQVIEAHL